MDMLMLVLAVKLGLTEVGLILVPVGWRRVRRETSGQGRRPHGHCAAVDVGTLKKTQHRSVPDVSQMRP